MMKKNLPFFPLNLVAFPGEELNLHVFEPRYKQLVNECLDQGTTFGIPAYIHNKLELGTEVEITELVKTYSDGRMDIRTKGLAIFKVLDYENPVEGKLYSGGMVEIQKINLEVDPIKVGKIKSIMKDFYKLLKVENPYLADEFNTSFSLAHKIGLSLEEEYQLLKISEETARLDFILEHLERTTPVVKELEKTKEKIAMNGHFKKLGPLDF